jgi:hypothetical protein
MDVQFYQSLHAVGIVAGQLPIPDLFIPKDFFPFKVDVLVLSLE